jgi:hypothetical protein
MGEVLCCAIRPRRGGGAAALTIDSRCFRCCTGVEHFLHLTGLWTVMKSAPPPCSGALFESRGIAAAQQEGADALYDCCFCERKKSAGEVMMIRHLPTERIREFQAESEAAEAEAAAKDPEHAPPTHPPPIDPLTKAKARERVAEIVDDFVRDALKLPRLTDFNAPSIVAINAPPGIGKTYAVLARISELLEAGKE